MMDRQAKPLFGMTARMCWMTCSAVLLMLSLTARESSAQEISDFPTLADASAFGLPAALQQKKGDESKGGKTTTRSTRGKTPKGSSRGRTPRRNPRNRTTPATGAAAPGKSPAKPTPRTPPPSGATEPVSSRLNINPDDLGKAPEERTYSFSIVDGSYKDLVENFARMAGIGVVGEAPIGPVTFVSTEEMNFKTALKRVRKLLFKYKPIEPYWLLYQDNRFEVLRVTDVPRHLPLDQIFINVKSFEASGTDDFELAMVLYTPSETSVADFTMLRDFMPDYVRIAPLEEANSITIFALAEDIKKYLSLIKLFEGAGDDPRILVKLPVNFISPTEAVELLRTLMGDELSENGKPGGTARRRRGGAEPINLPGQLTILFPDDAQSVIIVRAVTRQIDQIKEMLKFIDVDNDLKEADPVLIPIIHADVNEIMALISPLVTGERIQTPRAVTRNRGKNRGTANKPKTATMVQADAIALHADMRTNTLIVRASDEDVARVRRYVKMFDVPIEADRPEFVQLRFTTADQLAPLLTQIVVAKARGKQAVGDIFNAHAESSTNTLILTGSKDDIATARILIERFDVGDGGVELHSYRFSDASPTAAMELLKLLESAQGGGAENPGKKSPMRKTAGRRKAATGTGNMVADDATKMLHVICTGEEWVEHYLPMLERFDEQARFEPNHVRIELLNTAPDDVIQTLTQLFGASPKRVASGGSPRFSAAGGAILVTDATPSEIMQIKALIADIDVAGAGRVRRVFTLQYADPVELKALIDAGVISRSQPKRRRAGKTPTAAGEEPLIIVVYGRSLVVSGLLDDVEDISTLIVELDAPSDDDTAMRVYDVPPGHDVQNIVTLLETLLTGSASTRRARPAGKSGATQIAMMDNARIVAQMTTRRILIVAPVDRFEEIEGYLHELLEGASPESIIVKFISLTHASPAEVVDLLEPILLQRMQELKSTGELSTDGAPKGGRKQPAQGGITLTAEPNTGRIVVAAPPTIVAEAEALIAELDKPGSESQRIVRTIQLRRSDPMEMVTTLSAMISGKQSTPSARRPRLRRRSDAKAGDASASSTTTDDVAVVAAPGGGAIVLSGSPEAVDEVESWIKMLDETATSGTIMKVYKLIRMDPDEMADTVMDFCDTTGKPAKKADTVDDFGFDMLGGVRKGSEITITTDYINRIMLVRAKPVKIFEIDQLVQLYDGTESEEPEISASEPVPVLTFDLKYVDPFDATIRLESVLDVLWPHGDTPEVDYISGTNILVVKTLPEHEQLVLDYIKEYVDKESEAAKSSRAIVFKRVAGNSASEVAKLLKMRMPTLVVNLDQVGEDIPTVDQLKPYRPCALPMSLIETMGGVTLSAPTQHDAGGASDKSSDEDAKLAIKESLTADNEDQPVAEDAVRVRFDDRQGVLVIDGPPQAVEEVEDMLNDIMEEIESVGGKPDVRVFRIRYRNVNVVANLLQSMFAPQQRAAAANRGNRGAAAQQQRMKQMQQRMQQLQQQMARGQAPQQQPKGREGEQPADGKDGKAQKAGMSSITITADPQNRSVIVKAATEDFPIIVELLATIDRPTEIEEEFKIYKLEKLAAAQVEEQLKVLLGVSRPGRSPSAGRSPRPRGGRAGGQNQAMQQIEDALLNLGGMGGDAGSIDAASDIIITSNSTANTLLVKAPKPALDLISKFIEQLEAQDVPELVERSYKLEHADAVDVAARIGDVFKAKSGGSRRSADDARDPRDVNSINAIADARTNTLIVSAFEKDFPRVEILITQLDQPLTQESKPRVITLTDGKASDIANALKTIFDTGGGKGKRGGVKIVGDDVTSQLIVTAADDLFEEIEKLARTLDQSSLDIQPRIFKLEHAKAVDVHGKLMDIVRQLAQQVKNSKKLDVFTAVADERSNTIVAIGGPTAFMLVESVIREIDVPASESAASRSRKIVVLEHAEAADLARVINEFNRSRQVPASRGSAPSGPTVIANEALNTLLVGGTSEEVEEIVTLIKEFDQPSLSSERVVRVYSVNYADPGSLVGSLNQMFRPQRGSKPEDLVDVGYDWGTSKLVITASEENQKKIVKILEQVDVAAATVRSERIVKLKHANADELAGKLQELFSRIIRSERGQQTMTIAGDIGTGSLIVFANDAEFDRVTKLVATLDNKPDASRERLIRGFKLAHANPWATKQAITELFRIVGSRDPSREITAFEEWDTMSVIVAASADRMAEVEKFIADFDQPGASDSSIHVVELTHGDGESINRALQEMFKGGSKGKQDRRGPPVQISAIPGSDTILVKANEKDFEEILGIINELDTASGHVGEIEVITLVHTDADTMKEALETYLSMPGKKGGRGGSTELRGDVRISANTQNNTLIVSAAADHLNEIKDTIAKLDIEVEGGTAPRIVLLKNTRPSIVEPMLTKMFVDAGGRGGSGSRGRNKTQRMKPIIVADDASGTLIIRASASDYGQIRDLIDQLDAEDQAQQDAYTTIQVPEGLNVNELADMIQTTINEGERIKADRWGIDPQTVVITPDRRTNLLLVAGSAPLFADVRQLVGQMQSLGPVGGRTMRVLDPTNISSEELKRLLDGVIQENTSSTGRGSNARRGSSSRRPNSNRGNRGNSRRGGRRGRR